MPSDQFASMVLVFSVYRKEDVQTSMVLIYFFSIKINMCCQINLLP